MEKPNKEDYRFLISSEWKDLHHSRLQEWSALGVISGLHVGIIALIDAFRELPPVGVQTIVYFATLSGIVFSLIGILLTMRHRRLMNIKMGWILEAERKLGLLQTEDNPEGIIPTQELDVRKKKKWTGLDLPRLMSTSGLIFVVYLALILLDVITLLIYVNLM